MDAAFELFLEQGYSNVSMTDIIRRSGGSLSTAYELFENKTGLLRAIVTERCARTNQSVAMVSATAGHPRKALQTIARYFVGLLLEPDSTGLMRIIIAESLRDPAFGEYFRESAPETAIGLLSALFARWHAEGQLNVDDPRMAAYSFLALLMHQGQMSALCGLDITMTPDEMDRHIAHAVDMICARYGHRPPAAGEAAP